MKEIISNLSLLDNLLSVILAIITIAGMIIVLFSKFHFVKKYVLNFIFTIKVLLLRQKIGLIHTGTLERNYFTFNVKTYNNGKKIFIHIEDILRLEITDRTEYLSFLQGVVVKSINYRNILREKNIDANNENILTLIYCLRNNGNTTEEIRSYINVNFNKQVDVSTFVNNAHTSIRMIISRDYNLKNDFIYKK